MAKLHGTGSSVWCPAMTRRAGDRRKAQEGGDIRIQRADSVVQQKHNTVKQSYSNNKIFKKYGLSIWLSSNVTKTHRQLTGEGRVCVCVLGAGEGNGGEQSLRA